MISLTGAKTPVFSVPFTPKGFDIVPFPTKVPSVITFVRTSFSIAFFSVSTVTIFSIVNISLPSFPSYVIVRVTPLSVQSLSTFKSYVASLKSTTKVSLSFLVNMTVLLSLSNTAFFISSSFKDKKLLSISLIVNLQFFVMSSG